MRTTLVNRYNKKIWPGPVEGLEFDSGRRSLIFLLLFFSFGIFLVIVVLFCFFR